MKLSDEYLVRKIKDDYYLIPVGQKVVSSTPVSKISETAYLILKELEDNDLTFDELLERSAALLEADTADLPELKEYLDEFIKNTRSRSIIV